MNSFSFKYTAGFHVGKLIQIKDIHILMLCSDLKLKKDDGTVSGCPCCALHPVPKTGDRGRKNIKLQPSVIWRIGQY